jgi:hypothetical protein
VTNFNSWNPGYSVVHVFPLMGKISLKSPRIKALWGPRQVKLP